MKKIKMKSIKLFATALTVSSFMMVSCDVKKENTNEEEVIEIVEVEKDNIDVDADMDSDMNTKKLAEVEVKTRTYKMKKQEPIVYDLDANGIAGFDDWRDYTVVNYELAKIRKAKYITTDQRVKNMNYRIANLGNSIPDWLKTEEVMEDVADVQKEYLELIEDADASEIEMKENLEELTEKFDDLKEELDETVQQYVKIYESAIEEFNEGKIEAAIEEYNEEIKKMDRIVENK